MDIGTGGALEVTRHGIVLPVSSSQTSQPALLKGGREREIDGIESDPCSILQRESESKRAREREREEREKREREESERREREREREERKKERESGCHDLYV